jgi:hypothetical protein
VAARCLRGTATAEARPLTRSLPRRDSTRSFTASQPAPPLCELPRWLPPSPPPPTDTCGIQAPLWLLRPASTPLPPPPPPPLPRCVNPDTHKPYTVTMVERALHDIHFAVVPTKPAKQQALKAIAQLRKHYAIERARMRVRLTVPTAGESLRPPPPPTSPDLPSLSCRQQGVKPAALDPLHGRSVGQLHLFAQPCNIKLPRGPRRWRRRRGGCRRACLTPLLSPPAGFAPRLLPTAVPAGRGHLDSRAQTLACVAVV